MTGQRIKKLRKEKGLTQEQLGNLLGVKKSAIAKYENNRVENLKKETIQKLSEIFEVPATYFLGIDETNQPTITNSITIPLYNDISCGTGIFVDDNIDEYIALPESLATYHFRRWETYRKRRYRTEQWKKPVWAIRASGCTLYPWK